MMNKNTTSVGCPAKKMNRARAWMRFFLALILFAAFTAFFASGYTPPGLFGKVLRHNQANDIDASPLFYTEVENMTELEDRVRIMMEKAE